MSKEGEQKVRIESVEEDELAQFVSGPLTEEELASVTGGNPIRDLPANPVTSGLLP